MISGTDRTSTEYRTTIRKSGDQCLENISGEIVNVSCSQAVFSKLVSVLCFVENVAASAGTVEHPSGQSQQSPRRLLSARTGEDTGEKLSKGIFRIP